MSSKIDLNNANISKNIQFTLTQIDYVISINNKLYNI